MIGVLSWACRFLWHICRQHLPSVVWNVLNGDKDMVDAIITHQDIEAISFVGSTKVAEIIYETGTKHHMVIMPDADIDKAVDFFIGAACGAASQRCMAISVAMPVRNKTAKVFT